MEEFKKLGLSDKTLQVLEKKGFTEPTFIQAKVIPLLLEGKKDVVGQSQTGTGKTAAFALPILQKIKKHSKKIQAIILTPTRELAIQVADEINSLKTDSGIRVLTVYGGSPVMLQIKALRKGVDIVVGTPGRVMDLQRRKNLILDDILYAVLDEADEMLNMGFVEDIETILEHTPENKNMLLFSATMPRAILNIAKRYMREYDFIEVAKTNLITKTVEQIYYDVSARDRLEAIRRIVDYAIDFHGIIFCNTKSSVDVLAAQLIKMNYSAAALHGDITQTQREKILQQFRNGNVKILVATDVAARGIDVNDLTHVINYSFPQSAEAYVHRIGRTGRAGKKGIAVTFVIPSERSKLRFVERVNKCKLIKKELPSSKEIVNNKESQIKETIEAIINANKGKVSKFHSMAESLLEGHSPEEVVSAILKYSLKLDFDNYKKISEPKLTDSSSSGRGGYGGGRRRSGRSGGRGGSGRREGSRNRSDGRSSGKKSFRGRSDGKKTSFHRGKFDKNKSSDKKSGNKKRSDGGYSKKKKSADKSSFRSGRKRD